MLATAGAAVLLALLFWPAIVGNEVLSPSDMLLVHEPWRVLAEEGFAPGNPTLSDQVTQFQPWFSLARERWTSGEGVLWNERAAAGQPFAANLQSALYSPVAWLHRLCSFETALLLAALLKVVVAACFTALFARALGASVLGSLVAATAFSFSGFHWMWLGWPQASVSMFLPVLLFFAQERVEKGARWWNGPVWAGLVGAMLLSGHVETALHVSLAVGLFVTLRTLGRGEEGRKAWLGLAGWAVVGLLVAGIQLVPFLEYLGESTAYANRVSYSDVWRRIPWEQGGGWLILAGLVGLGLKVGRSTLDAEEWGSACWGGAALLALIFAGGIALADSLGLSPFFRLLVHPDSYGHPVPARGVPFAGLRSYLECNGAYIGLLTLGLAFVAAVCGPLRNKGLGAVKWLWALGFIIAYQVPLLGPLVNRLPLLNVSHNNRLMLWMAFAGSILAAFGLDLLTGKIQGRRPIQCSWRLGLPLMAGFAVAPLLPMSSFMDALVPHGIEESLIEEGATPFPGTEVPSFTAMGLGGGVVPVTDVLGQGDRVAVRGWALTGAIRPNVVIELVQAGRRVVQHIAAKDMGSPEMALPPTLRAHPFADRCGFSWDGDLQTFEGGAVWLRVTLEDEDRSLLIEDRALRYQPGQPAGKERWVLGLLALGVLAWGTLGKGERGALAWVGLAVVTADALLFARGFNPTAPGDLLYPAPPVLEQLQMEAAKDPGGFRIWSVGRDLLPPNTASVYGLSDVRAYDALGVERFDRFLTMLRPPPERAVHPGETLDVSHPLFALLDVAFILGPATWIPPVGAPVEKVVETGGVVLHRYTGPRTRAFFVPEAASITDYLSPPAREEDGHPLRLARQHLDHVALALSKEYRERLDWKNLIAVENEGVSPMSTPGKGGDVAVTPKISKHQVTQILRQSDRVEMDCVTDAPGWLCVTDTAFPGWEVTVNDERVEWSPAFFAFRAVQVPTGQSRVVFHYDPESSQQGTTVTRLGVILLCLGLVVGWRRRSSRTIDDAADLKEK